MCTNWLNDPKIQVGINIFLWYYVSETDILSDRITMITPVIKYQCKIIHKLPGSEKRIFQENQGFGLLKNGYVKIHISYQGFSNMVSDWLAACCQPIRSHVRKSRLTNLEFNMDLS